MNFWSTQEEIKFFDQMLNSNFLAIEKVFYKIDNEYFAYIPTGIKNINQTLQSRNSYIGDYTETWCKNFLTPIASKLGLFVVQNVICEEIGLNKSSGADLAFCTTNDQYQKPENIKIIFEVKMSIVSNYKLIDGKVVWYSDYHKHQGIPSLLRSDSMLKAIGKAISVRVYSSKSANIPIIIIGNTPISKNYENKVDHLKISGVIQSFINIFPNLTENVFTKESKGGGYITSDDYELLSSYITNQITKEMFYFSAMLPISNLGGLINKANAGTTDIEKAKIFLNLLKDQNE